MNNLDFFNISILNSKINYDFSDPVGVIVIPKTATETNDLVEANHKLIKLITAYEELKKINPNSTDLNKIIEETIHLLETTKYINYSAFCVYFQVLRYSYNTYSKACELSNEEKIDLIKSTIELFIKNRHDIYLSHGYSDIVLQVMCDASSSRRNGNTGTKKLSEIMQLFAIKKVDSLKAFAKTKNTYILPDKGDSKVLNEIIDFYGIDFTFRNSRENKNPDIVFKLGTEIYILEHKLTNGGGGSQNMEINEIISFIGYSESNPKVHYVSCLQGDYLKRLNLENKEPKVKAQYQNIISNLRKNKKNYFINEFGLSELLKSKTKNAL